MPTQKIQPQTLFQRALGGHVLYNHVVVVETQRLIFVSGQLARNKAGEIVGPRDMRAQIAGRRKSPQCAGSSRLHAR
jgi:enamine deaminase RidA (YjgF/YER057c/UK114 family)